MLNSSHVDQFRRDGFLIVPNVLTPKETADLRATLVKLFSSPSKFDGDTGDTRYDVCARYPELRWILVHPPILAALRTVLGQDFVYLPEMAATDSSFGGWHKDTTSQEVAGHMFQHEPDFLMVESALYLQDNDEEYGGGLDVIVGSHTSPDPYVKSRRPPSGPWETFMARVRGRLKRYLPKPPAAKKPESFLIPSKAGDLVIFNFKVDHKASWPKQKPVPPERRKFSIFFACSANNRHVNAYVKFLQSRSEYKYLPGHRYPQDLQQLATDHHITLQDVNARQ